MGRISAQKLHVKKLVAPWLNVDHTPEDLLTGVSFASGATGYDPLTPKIVVCTLADLSHSISIDNII